MSLMLAPAEQALVLKTPLFAVIDQATALWLLDGAAVSAMPEGGLVFGQGDPADRFFVVLAGRVNLFALTETGEQSIIEVVDQGHSFAEGAIFASGRFPLNGEATAGTRLLVIPAAPFLKKLAEKKGLSASLLASLALWQRRLMGEIADLKGRSPVQRLGSFLLALAGSPEGSEAVVQLPLTKSELASRIGITPESLSRAVNRLKPLGVTSRGREFFITDFDALRRFCGGE